MLKFLLVLAVCTLPVHLSFIGFKDFFALPPKLPVPTQILEKVPTILKDSRLMININDTGNTTEEKKQFLDAAQELFGNVTAKIKNYIFIEDVTVEKIQQVSTGQPSVTEDPVVTSTTQAQPEANCYLTKVAENGTAIVVHKSRAEVGPNQYTDYDEECIQTRLSPGTLASLVG